MCYICVNHPIYSIRAFRCLAARFLMRGRDRTLQRDEILFSVAMEDGVREEGQRAEVAGAIQLLKQVYERGTSPQGSRRPRPPSLVLQDLAQMSAGWEEGSMLVMLNWKAKPVCPSLPDGKPSRQPRKDHRKKSQMSATGPALAGCTIPSLLVGL